MTRSDIHDDSERGEVPSLTSLLAYERQLDGHAFTRQVMGRAVHRGYRGWILFASTVCSLTVAIGIKPDNFTFLSGIRLPVGTLSAIAASVPAGGLVAMLLVGVLMVGASKTADSI
jgi:hypothetical protein